MNERILLPLNGLEFSERAIPYAISLAEGLGATVTLFWVAEASGEMPDRWFLDYLEKKVWEIRNCGESKDVFLIAIATQGQSGFRHHSLGSVAIEVVQGTSEPLLIVRPQPRILNLSS